MEKKHKKKELFVEGPISPAFIAESIAKHATKTDIGAHQLFLGQIRADEIDGKRVASIEFTAYREMAEEAYTEFRETLFERHQLTCMHVYHSLGIVKAGEINLLVFVSSKHRNDAIAACSELVEWIKSSLPVWGKEIFEDESIQWKVNY